MPNARDNSLVSISVENSSYLPRIFYQNLCQYMNVLFYADFLQLLGPHNNTELSEMGFPQQKHLDPRLTDSAPYGQRYLVIHDSAVIGLL